MPPKVIQAGFGRHQDRASGDVRGVSEQQIHPTHQRCRKWLIEVAFEYANEAGEASQVAAGATHRGRVDVGGVELDLLQP